MRKIMGFRERDSEEERDDLDDDDILVIVLVVVLVLVSLALAILGYLFWKRRRDQRLIEKSIVRSRASDHRNEPEMAIRAPPPDRWSPRPPFEPPTGVTVPNSASTSYPEECDSELEGSDYGGPYSGATEAHRWVPPIHKMEPPPDYREHEERHPRF